MPWQAYEQNTPHLAFADVNAAHARHFWWVRRKLAAETTVPVLRPLVEDEDAHTAPAVAGERRIRGAFARNSGRVDERPSRPEVQSLQQLLPHLQVRDDCRLDLHWC